MVELVHKYYITAVLICTITARTFFKLTLLRIRYNVRLGIADIPSLIMAICDILLVGIWHICNNLPKNLFPKSNRRFAIAFYL